MARMSVKVYFYQNDIGHVYYGIGFFFVESVDIVVKFCVPCYTYVIVVRVVLFIHTPCDVCCVTCVSVLPILLLACPYPFSIHSH